MGLQFFRDVPRELRDQIYAAIGPRNIKSYHLAELHNGRPRTSDLLVSIDSYTRNEALLVSKQFKKEYEEELARVFGPPTVDVRVSFDKEGPARVVCSGNAVHRALSTAAFVSCTVVGDIRKEHGAYDSNESLWLEWFAHFDLVRPYLGGVITITNVLVLEGAWLHELLPHMSFNFGVFMNDVSRLERAGNTVLVDCTPHPYTTQNVVVVQDNLFSVNKNWRRDERLLPSENQFNSKHSGTRLLEQLEQDSRDHLVQYRLHMHRSREIGASYYGISPEFLAVDAPLESIGGLCSPSRNSPGYRFSNRNSGLTLRTHW